MATYSTDFSDSDYGTGSPPPDWTARYGADQSDPLTDFTVESAPSGVTSFGDQILQVDYQASGGAALSWDDVGSNADVDMKVRVRWTQSIASQRACGFVARGNEDSAGDDGYTITADAYSSVLKLYKLVNGSDSNIANATIYPAIVVDQWYWVRFQVNGTALKCRIWKDGDDEPATWDIDETDSDVSAAGWCGVYTRYGGDAEVDWFGAGTGVDAPPAAPSAEGDARVTQVAVEVLRAGDPDARVTQVAVEVLRRNRRNQGGTVVIVG